MKLSVPSSLLAALLLSQGRVLATQLRGAGERELTDPVCMNTNNNWLAHPADNGCDFATPVCVDKDGREVTGYEAEGDGCVVCINDKSGASSWNPDKGCANGVQGTLAFCVLEFGGEPETGKPGHHCAHEYMDFL
jgi:hypothetical protein